MIRQLRIHLDFVQNCCVYSRLLARSAAHPQLQVLRCLKHGSVCRCYDKSGFSIGLCEMCRYAARHLCANIISESW